MSTIGDAAAFAGISQNAHYTIPQRLQASKQALDAYVAQQDQLQELLEELRSKGEEADTLGWSGYADAAVKLAAILDGE